MVNFFFNEDYYFCKVDFSLLLFYKIFVLRLSSTLMFFEQFYKFVNFCNFFIVSIFDKSLKAKLLLYLLEISFENLKKLNQKYLNYLLSNLILIDNTQYEISLR